MKKYLITINFILFILASQNCFSQKKYLFGSLWGLPLFQSAFGYGNLGFEYHSKKGNAAWQFSINLAGGEIGNDAGATHRKWITVDRLKNFKPTPIDNTSSFYTLFIEAGSRKKDPGFIRPVGDSILNQKRAFEINPGIGIGRNFKLFKKMRLQLIAAPKTIFAFHNDKYYNLLNKNYFYSTYSDLKIGFRIAANFCLSI